MCKNSDDALLQCSAPTAYSTGHSSQQIAAPPLRQKRTTAPSQPACMRPTGLLLQQRAHLFALHLLELLAKRCTLVVAIGELKRKHHLPLRDTKRERALLRAVTTAGHHYSLHRTTVRTLFQQIIQISLMLQATGEPYPVACHHQQYILPRAYPSKEQPLQRLYALRRRISVVDYQLLTLVGRHRHLTQQIKQFRHHSSTLWEQLKQPLRIQWRAWAAYQQLQEGPILLLLQRLL